MMPGTPIDVPFAFPNISATYATAATAASLGASL